MKKLALDIDTITVQSFEIATPDVSRGTVQGREVTPVSGAWPGCRTNCSCPNTE